MPLSGVGHPVRRQLLEREGTRGLKEAIADKADVAVLDAPSYTHLVYRPGMQLVAATVEGGRLTSGSAGGE